MGLWQTKPNQTKPNQTGFTLVELSIVIVIIGLIITGITAGQSLVKSARLKAIATNKDMYTTAMNAFQMQYNALAGDITNATTYWPGGVPNGAAANGNGDRMIVGAWEGADVWQHLKLAGLIKNSNYDGTHSTTGIVGKSWGVSGYSNTVGFIMFTFGLNGSGWGYNTAKIYQKTGNIVFGLGAVQSVTTYISGAALTPNEAYGLDKKIDDGNPATGSVVADNGYDTGITTCTDNASALASNISTAVNYLNNDTVGCRMMFIYK